MKGKKMRKEITKELAQREREVNILADSAKSEEERIEVIRTGLSSNVLGASVSTPKDIGLFIAQCWDQGINPLPAFRKRLGPSWAVVAHCYASQPEDLSDCYVGELFLEIPVNATGVQFCRVVK